MERTAQARAKQEQGREKQTATVLERVAELQTAPQSLTAFSITLDSHTNCSLMDSFLPKRASNNNLEELPMGSQVFGGIPFKITGRIQLGCGALAAAGWQFPQRVDGITISSKCRRIHLFHGALFANKMGEPIAKLIIHYEDDSQQAIEIVAGRHVLDWWGPTHETGALDDGSELAWVGSNPYIRVRQPKLAARLYKSTFENPKPLVTVKTLDYVSTQTPAAPFLLGLAVE
jgi:hypothetical protein